MAEVPINCSHTDIAEVASLVENPRNPNGHPESQIDLLAKIIANQGWRSPIVVSNRSGFIVKGHGRYQAALKLGVDTVPIDRQDYETEAQEWADLIADNRLSELAEINRSELKDLLEDLDDGDFDMDLTGFLEGDLADMMSEFAPENEGLTDEDAVPEMPEEPTAKLGQIWKLGNHRLMCGDSTSKEQVAKLMDGEKADMVFTDPPYGIKIVSNNQIGGGGAFGTGKKEKAGGRHIEANKYADIIGDDSIETAVEAIKIIKSLEIKTQIIWGGNYYATELENSNCWIVWDKETGESTFADAELAWTNQETKVQIFKHRWSGICKASEHGEKRVHPTQKPIALAEWCFDNYGNECKSVLDLFGGSGSTLIACEIRGKGCFMMEFAPSYCDVIIQRWEEFTGNKAELIEELEGVKA